MARTTDLPRRNEDRGLPNRGRGPIPCLRPFHPKPLFSQRKILWLLPHCSLAPFLCHLYLQKALALPEQFSLWISDVSIRNAFSPGLLGLWSSFPSFPKLGKEEPVSC